jgi:hypothetical protein
MSLVGAAFSPTTLALLRSVYDEACASIPGHQLTQEARFSIADRILKVAADGERDPVRLRTHALSGLAVPSVARRAGLS